MKTLMAQSLGDTTALRGALNEGREPAVQRALNRLGPALEAIEMAFTNLAIALNPVLRPMPPSDSGDGRAKPKESLCQLADTIDGNTEWALTLGERVRELQARLEI